jgi:acyl-CoA reductase-like NAD-dependent aldehyde dehydrogenase
VTIDDARTHVSPEVSAWLDRVALGDLGPNVIGAHGEILDVVDPGTGRRLVSLVSASPAEVAAAVERARRAHDDGRWSEVDADRRERVLMHLAALLERDREMLTTIEAIDTGKPRTQAVDDIDEAIAVLRYYAGWCTKITGDTIAAPRRFAASTLRGPVGVCAAITPWNYPLPILVYKLAPALAFGNAFVAKPSELAPLSAIHLAEICEEAGIPEGIVSVVIGAGETGAALVADPRVDKIAFTGSTRTGQAIMTSAARRPTPVTLELGGKSPHLVFAGADLDAAADAVAGGIWTNAGQVCVAGSRLLVEESVHDEFVTELVERTRRMVVGHALEPAADIGPMITDVQRSRAATLIAGAVADGARIATGGRPIERPGFFLEPTVIVDVPTEATISQHEVFGPVLVVDTFRTEAEAIAKANGTEYGLAAGVWTSHGAQAQRMARALRAGTVWINTYGVFHPTLPFGGTKASGFGRDLGAAAIESYTSITTVVEDITHRSIGGRP